MMFLVLSFFVSVAEATKPYKEVVTEKIEGPGIIQGYYVKEVVHGTFIAKPIEEGLAKVAINLVQKFHIYELTDTNEAGDFLCTAKITYEYTGTVVTDNGLTVWTGTEVLSWVINADIEIPEGTYKGHWVIIYEEGVVVKETKRGVPPFPIPPP